MQNPARKSLNGTYSLGQTAYPSITAAAAPAPYSGYSLQGNPSWNGTNNDGFYGNQPVMALNQNIPWQQPVAFIPNQAIGQNGISVISGYATQPYNVTSAAPVAGIAYPTIATLTNPSFVAGTNPALAPQGVVAQNQQADSLFPPCDVKETSDSYLFHADVPGIKDNQIEISLFGNQMAVSGKREVEQKKNGETLFMAERTHGTFSRVFNLPENVNTNKVQAELKDGVLCITLPKNAATPAKKITVSSKK